MNLNLPTLSCSNVNQIMDAHLCVSERVDYSHINAPSFVQAFLIFTWDERKRRRRIRRCLIWKLWSFRVFCNSLKFAVLCLVTYYNGHFAPEVFSATVSRQNGSRRIAKKESLLKAWVRSLVRVRAIEMKLTWELTACLSNDTSWLLSTLRTFRTSTKMILFCLKWRSTKWTVMHLSLRLLLRWHYLNLSSSVFCLSPNHEGETQHLFSWVWVKSGNG